MFGKRFWKDSTLYTEALVDIAFALQAPEGTDIVGEAEKILQVRLGAGLEAALREEARRICRYRIEFTQDAIETFDLSGNALPSCLTKAVFCLP